MFTRCYRGAGVLCLLLAAGSCSKSPTAPPGPEAPAGAGGIEPRARQVVEDTWKYIASAQRFSVIAESTTRVQGPGMSSETTSTHRVALQRPDRFAIVREQGTTGGTIVCDGTHLYTHLPALKKYTVEDAAPPEEAVTGLPYLMSMGGGGMVFLTAFFVADPAAHMMEGVTEGHYAGTADLDGVKVHHLKFAQEQFDWEMWVEAGDKPLIRKITADLGKAMRKAGGEMESFKNARMDATLTLRDWKVDVDLPTDAFKFEPPEGAEKADDLMASLGARETHPLVGRPAPPIRLKLLDGGDFDLAEHKGQHIVILDFWASWCGPCVQALPGVTEVAGRFKDQGVVLYAINVDEDAETIRRFLKQKKLSMPVPLDEDGQASDAYQARGIPHMVLIGKDGVIQAVHAGYAPSMKRELAGQIESLLAGRSLVPEAASKPARDSAATAPAGEAEVLSAAWTVPGRWDSVAADSEGRIFAVGRGGRLLELDAAGQQVRTDELKDGGFVLRLAELDNRPGAECVSFEYWGKTVAAHGSDGKPLWTYPGGQGVDDVWPADLDGDGASELVVGYNGDTGLHVLDQAGKLRWKDTSIANVWHVCAGDINGDGEQEVVTTSALGKVHVFSREGRKLKNLDTGFYANLVLPIGPGAKGAACDLLVAGLPGLTQQRLVRLGFDGRERWSVELAAGRGSYIDSAAVATRHPLAAIGLRDGVVKVFDIEKGGIVAVAEGQGQQPRVAWCEPADGPPLLNVATGRAVNAFRVDGEE